MSNALMRAAIGWGWFRWAMILHWCLAIGIATFGVLYITRGKIMPYHEAAIGLAWSQLPNEQQVLFVALMRVAGSGWLITAIAMAGLLHFVCRPGNLPSLILVATLGFFSALCAFAVSFWVSVATPSHPPWQLALAGAAASLVALAMSLHKPHNTKGN